MLLREHARTAAHSLQALFFQPRIIIGVMSRNLRLGASYGLDDATDILLGCGYEQRAQGNDYFDTSIADNVAFKGDIYLLGVGVTVSS